MAQIRHVSHPSGFSGKLEIPVCSVGVPDSGFQCLMFEGYLIEISEKLAKIALRQWWSYKQLNTCIHLQA